jgi:adenylate cyclase class 2
MPNENEIKFAVADVTALCEKLRHAGFRELTPRTHEMNVLFDFPEHFLRQRGELLRLRQYGERWTLTHKARGVPGPHKSRDETETSVGDGGALTAILGKLGFKESFRYEKFRSEWSDGVGEIVVDETPVGDFAEIEGAPDWIDKTAHALDVAPQQYITKSYAELFDDWRKRTRSPAAAMTFAACRA